MTQKLGDLTWNLDCMIEGSFSLEEFKEKQLAFIRFLGMDPADMEPDVRSFPLPDGRGGVGHSLFQPFVEPKYLHQPLTTSFCIIDIWPDRFTITTKSCIQFCPTAAANELRRLFGIDSIIDTHAYTLGKVARTRRAFCGVGSMEANLGKRGPGH